MLVADEVAFAPDLAVAAAVEVASRVAADAAETGRFVDSRERTGRPSRRRSGRRTRRSARSRCSGAAGGSAGASGSSSPRPAGSWARASAHAARWRTRSGQIAQLSEQALQDETTGLPNRRALLRWLTELDAGRSLAVLLVDFDGLRAVNNVLGHQAGDELIRRVAAGIQETLRPGELVARLHGSGGDEFVVCCPISARTRRWSAPASSSST